MTNTIFYTIVDTRNIYPVFVYIAQRNYFLSKHFLILSCVARI
jgi:hypothetical protein|uniref:Uncharacterized protein n=1 Tax=virus sp. ctML55 TaxID=2827627 RepID=A0A8S5RIK3_9VIRU|nr:MAG TPA: hypothetical protein [virus sp. ctML55]